MSSSADGSSLPWDVLVPREAGRGGEEGRLRGAAGGEKQNEA